MRLAVGMGALLAGCGLVVWWVLGWAEADDVPTPMAAWAEIVYAWFGRDAVAGVFAAGAGLFWLSALAVRAPSVAAALVIGVVELGLVWLWCAWGGQPGGFALWFALVFAAALIPWKPARLVGLASVWFGGAGLGALAAGWAGGSAWLALPVWLALIGLGVSVARAPAVPRAGRPARADR